MTVKLLTELHSEFLSIKGDSTGSSESTLVKTPHCWKSHVTAHIYIQQKQNNECMLSTTCLEPKAADVCWSKGLRSFYHVHLQCMTAGKLEDVSSVENVHMVTENLSQVFISCCKLHLPSLSSIVSRVYMVHLN